MNVLPFIFLGGGFGASLRWLLYLGVEASGAKLWIGTLIANILGCLLLFLGIKFAWFEHPRWNPFLKVGFIGGLTTFSAFSYELVILGRQAKWGEFGLCLTLNMSFGILMGIKILR